MRVLHRVVCFGMFALALSSAMAVTLCCRSAAGHELWIEAPATAAVDQAYDVDVCWGHSGARASGQSLEGQRNKLTVRAIDPDGNRADLAIDTAADCFQSEFTPAKPGCYVVGGELQTGITARQMHSIPPNTRIIMYGKTVTQVAGRDAGLDRPIGQDLEIVLLTPPDALKPGAVAKARLLFGGKPLGGRNVELTLSTAGDAAPPEDPQIQSPVWSTSAVPHPKTGEVAFPVIAGGRHFFTIRHVDEMAGVYDGDRNDESSFSHLRKGDRYERTMYISTLTVMVDAQ